MEDKIIPIVVQITSPVWLTIFKDIANIVFFLGVPTLAFLAYSQTRKTIFSSQKTEVFKKQLETLAQTAEYFHFHDPSMMIERMRFDVIGTNTLSAAYHFSVEASKSAQRPQDKSFSLSGNWHSMKMPLGCFAEEKKVGNETHFKEIYDLFFPYEYSNELKRLRSLASSIYLPDDIENMIVSFEKAIPSIYPAILEGVNKALDQMMERCVNGTKPLEIAKNLRYSWFNLLKEDEEIKGLFNLANDIQKKIKAYANVDKVWN